LLEGKRERPPSISLISVTVEASHWGEGKKRGGGKRKRDVGSGREREWDQRSWVQTPPEKEKKRRGGSRIEGFWQQEGKTGRSVGSTPPFSSTTEKGRRNREEGKEREKGELEFRIAQEEGKATRQIHEFLSLIDSTRVEKGGRRKEEHF